MYSGKGLLRHIGRLFFPIHQLLINLAGQHHPGYGIGAGKQWKLRAAVNYALAAGKIIQVLEYY